MKRILSFIISIGLILSLCSCNKVGVELINNKILIQNRNEMLNMNYFDFNEEIEEGQTILTKYKGKDLILVDLTVYEGPLTMQLLPYGGIQSVYNYNLIIHFKNGYFKPAKVIYEHNEMTVKKFITNNTDLVNYILG